MTDKAAAWTALEAAARADGAGRIEARFTAEPDRLERLTLEAAGLSIDLSKQPWSRAGQAAAIELAGRSNIEGRARATVRRRDRQPLREAPGPAHGPARARTAAKFMAAGKPVSPEVEATRAAMKAFADGVRSGAIKGATGKPFRKVVHIGIGGSDLGPKLVWEALRPLDGPIELRFAANVDGAEIAAALNGLDPAETLVIVVSKTFGTQETLSNAIAARAWLTETLGEGAGAHFVAVSANTEAARKFGVAPERIFAFWDWVGGRYSLWSAVGLSTAIGLGWDVFAQLLAGGSAMDEHFYRTPLETNAPAMLALAHVFNHNGLGRPIRAVVPYARRMALLPAFLQQLEMESNGKRVTDTGGPLHRETAAAVFGDAGTNGQHAFFQMLHQGTEIIPVDIIAVAQADEGPPKHQTMLLANAVAQAEALMIGRASAAEPLARLSRRPARPASCCWSG